MENQEIAVRLLKGSTAIDRMKDDVNREIAILTGLIRKTVMSSHALYLRIDKMYKSSTCTWLMYSLSNSGSYYHNWTTDRLIFECWLHHSYGDSAAYSTSTYSHSQNFSACGSQEVQRVYEGLGFLVAGLKQSFPDIEKAWQFLLDASTVYPE